MGRREELMLEFAELCRGIQESGYRGRLRLGAWFLDTVPERKQHGKYLVNRVWNPRSYTETMEMIGWCLLMEKFFGYMPTHQLMTIFADQLKPRT